MALEFIRACDREKVRPSLLVLLEGGTLLEEARRLDIPCHHLRWKGKWDRRAVREFGTFLSRNEVRLIHNFGLRSDLLSRLLAPSRGIRRIVSGIRDTDPWRRWPHVMADRLTARRVDLYIANSHAARRASLSREKMPPEKVIVIHNGIRFPPGGGAGAGPELPPRRSPVLAMVANLKPGKKGHDVLFEALAGLRHEFPEILLVCAGQDLSGGAIPALAESAGVAGLVHFTGYCDNVAAVLRAADVAVLPSRFESFPASIVEAMAEGLPVVASRVGGIAEIIRDGENGLLVESGNAGQLRDTLARLLRDGEERARLGEAARRTVAADFTVEIMARLIEDAYLGLMEKGKS